MRRTQIFGKVNRLSWAGFVLAALCCLPPSMVLSQTSESTKQAGNHWDAQPRLALDQPIGYAQDRGVSLSLLLSQPQGARLNPTVTNDTFTNAAGTGFWSNASNWSSGLPGSSSNVLITGTGSASSVTEDMYATINNLTVNSTNAWTLNNGLALTIDGDAISNAGKMTMNSTGNLTELMINSPAVTLSGGGTLTLSNSLGNYIVGASTADTLTNQETIQGAGNIGNAQMTLVNSGTINANQSAGMTIYANGGATNAGTMEATGGARLTLQGTTVTNTGGTISASGSDLLLDSSTINGGTVTLTGASLLQLAGSTLHGGSTLNNSTTGTIEAISYDTLGGTVNNPAGGVIKIDNGATLNLESGSYPKLGAVTLNSTGSLDSTLVVHGGITLSGGSVTLSNSSGNYIVGTTTADSLTNQETIQGAGNIGNSQMTLVNSGTINANQSAGMEIYVNGGATNTGTMEATGGARLTLNGTTIANTGGTISANGSNLLLGSSTINGGTVTLTGASLLQLANSTIHGGSTLNNSATGTIEAISYDTLGGTVNNPAGGVIKIDNGATLNLESGSYPKLGAVTLNATSGDSALVVHGGVTLSGGSVTLSNSPGNSIAGVTTADSLTNQETIQGAGYIGNAQMALVNSGTINANQSNTLFVDNNSFTNNGTLLVNTGDLMHVEGGKFTNFSGSTLTGGTYNTSGTLEIDNVGNTGGEIVTNAATIILNGTASSFVDAGGKDALANLAINATGSGLTIMGGRNLTTAGNFTNNGTVTVGSGSKFDVNGNLTNFSGTTLTGGAYNITGTLQFNSANIVTNAANITLTGTLSQIVNQTSGNGLANFATNASSGNFTLAGGHNFTTAGNFTNNGTLTVGSGSKFDVNGNLTNFSGTTLTGGTYNITGTLQFNGANIMTNAANITLTGINSKIIDQSSNNALAGFTTNSSAASFTLAGNQSLTTSGGSFTNSGAVTINKGSTFTAGNGGTTSIPVNYTQAGGTTQVDGTLTSTTSSSTPTLTISGGSLDGAGNLAYTVVDSGTLAPGDSSTKTAALKVSGPYTQTSSGLLNISIGGKTPGTQYDQLNVTGTAGVNGTLNLGLVNHFVPTVGTTFNILNASALSGTFATVNGTSINSGEHFVVSYNGNDVVLTVASGPGSLSETSGARRLWATADLGRLGNTGDGRMQSPSVSLPGSHNPYRSTTIPFARVPVSSRHSLGAVVMGGTELASPAVHPNATSLGAFRTARSSTAVLPNRNRLEYGLNLLSLFGTNPKHLMKGLLGQAGSPDTAGYLSFSGAH